MRVGAALTYRRQVKNCLNQRNTSDINELRLNPLSLKPQSVISSGTGILPVFKILRGFKPVHFALKFTKTSSVYT